MSIQVNVEFLFTLLQFLGVAAAAAFFISKYAYNLVLLYFYVCNPCHVTQQQSNPSSTILVNVSCHIITIVSGTVQMHIRWMWICPFKSLLHLYLFYLFFCLCYTITLHFHIICIVFILSFLLFNFR